MGGVNTVIQRRDISYWLLHCKWNASNFTRKIMAKVLLVFNAANLKGTSTSGYTCVKYWNDDIKELYKP